MPGMSDMLWPAMSIFGMALAPFSGFWSCAQKSGEQHETGEEHSILPGHGFSRLREYKPRVTAIVLRIFGAAR